MRQLDRGIGVGLLLDNEFVHQKYVLLAEHQALAAAGEQWDYFLYILVLLQN